MRQIEKEAIERLLTGQLGRPLWVYDCVESTNDTAKTLARQGARHGTTVVAKKQTKGRGRMGRSFYSPREGVYVTVILRPEFLPADFLLITAAAGVAVAQAVEAVCGLQPKIKWVNDVYYGGKKLCGILTESVLHTDGTLGYAVAGIGINLYETDFPEELRGKAVSLEGCGAAQVDGNRLVAVLLNSLDAILSSPDPTDFLRYYKERSCVIGRRVTMIQGEHSEEVQAVDIDGQARLVVLRENGEKIALGSGEISLRGEFL